MERNLVYRSVPIVLLLLAVVMLPSVVGAADPDSNNADMKGAETPQALVATYHHALAAKDWRSCFLCYDPKMRADFLSRMFYAVAVSRDAKLDSLFKKRLRSKFASTDEITIPDASQDGREAEKLSVYEALQKQLNDLPGFVDEICGRFDAMGQATFSEVGDVREISIQEDRAVGYWNRPVKPIGPAGSSSGKTTSDEANSHGTPVPAAPSQSNVAGVPGEQEQPLSDNRLPVHFRKMDGRWYMTIPDPPPPLSVRERAKLLKAEVDSLFVYLCCSTGTDSSANEPNQSNMAQLLSEKRYGELRLSVRPYAGTQLTEAQAKKLIDYLAAEGYLRQAVELGKHEVPQRALSENCYTIQVSTQNLQLHEDLGWGPGMLKRLDGLRGALDGEAAQAMNAILTGLADDRKKWEKQLEK